MWTRKELKRKAKQALKRNYWKTVLIALVFTLVCSGAGAAGSAAGAGNDRSNDYSHSEIVAGNTSDELAEQLEQLNSIDMTDPDNPPIEETMDTLGLISQVETEDESAITGNIFGHHFALSASDVFAIAAVVFVIFAVVLALVLAITAFLTNPVEVGTARFFTRNLNQSAEVKEVAFGFDHNYLQTVKTMILRDIRTLLWGLLLIIPGIVKAYEYRMIPYLLADDPTMTTDEAFAQSKRMMSGNKWRAFVLDLSFIGWYLLAIPTLGLVTLFYASPYKKMTDAALYEQLRYGDEGIMDAEPLPLPTPTVAPVTQVPVAPFAAADAPAPEWDDEATSSVVSDDPQA